MPGGRGDFEEYINQAVEEVEKALGCPIPECEVEVKAAVAAGIIDIFRENVIPSYFLQENYPKNQG